MAQEATHRNHAALGDSRGDKGPVRADQLQFLRFLAFCLVFVWHANKWSFPFFPSGYGAAEAVAFFFMLSGTVTGYSHFDDEVRLKPRMVGGYVWRKIRKIYPLYIFTMLFAVSYSSIPKWINLHWFDRLKTPLTYLFRDVLLIQSWFPKGYFSFNGVGWFISTLLFLYLLTLPLLSLAQRMKRSKYPALTFAASTVALSLAAVAYCYVTRHTEMEYTQYVLPVARVWEYGAGICLGFLTRLLKPRLSGPRTRRILLFTVAEVAAFALWIVAPYLRGYPKWCFRIVHWLLPNILLLSSFAIGEGLLSRVFRAKPLVSLGDLSFECFLLHQIILTTYDKINAFEEIGKLGRAFNLALCMLLTLMLARLIHGAGRPKPEKP